MKVLKILGLIVAGLLILLALWVAYHIRDRHPGYHKELAIEPAAESHALRAGFAAVPITPKVEDTWTDANGDAKFREEDGDKYEDRNGNGRFDAFWLAGFQQRRPAAGVHDDLWARCMVIDDGRTRIALVVLDAIGLLHDDVLRIRDRIPGDLGVTYTIVCATHVHEAPDLIGIWGPSPFRRGVNDDYLDFVIGQAAKSVQQAVAGLRPAKLRFAQTDLADAGLVEDGRDPQVFDSGLRLIHAVDAEADTTLGVLIAWANHPESMWSKNLLVTSDFPHYVRKFVEEGLHAADGRVLIKGMGGTAVYVNGAIGGLMTTSPEVSVPALDADTSYSQPSFAKTRALGAQVASRVCSLLRSSEVEEIQKGTLALRVKTFRIKLQNPIFRLAAALGIIDRGFTGWLKMRTEASAWRLGPASFITVPGEIYPEIVNGGIEAPPGQDFATAPVEVPPLRELMPGRYKFVFGLANDEIGYIIPKSEWDEAPPFLYNAESSPYGEVNSVGPDAGPTVYQAVKSLLEGWSDTNGS